MAQQGGIQGITQVSVLGQLPVSLLDQVLRRLEAHTEHQYDFTVNEDVLTRGTPDSTGALREEDVLRVRATTSQGKTDWCLTALSRPVPARDNPDVLIRTVSSTPIVEGNAGALAVALGYSERKFAFRKTGHAFVSDGGLTTTQVYQLYNPSDAHEALQPSYYLLEVIACTALKPQPAAGAAPMQTLRDNAVYRVMEMKRVLKGLVDLQRVE